MLILLGVFFGISALMGVYVLGYRMGSNDAQNASKTTYDQTLDYLSPVNEFIDRIIVSEIHRRHGGYRKPDNGQVFLAWLVSDAERLSEFFTSIVALSIGSMSKNLKNSFYRVYFNDRDKKTGKSTHEFLSGYIFTRVTLYIREQTTKMVLQTGGDSSNKDLERNYMLGLEAELQKHFGYGKGFVTLPKTPETKK